MDIRFLNGVEQTYVTAYQKAYKANQKKRTWWIVPKVIVNPYLPKQCNKNKAYGHFHRGLMDGLKDKHDGRVRTVDDIRMISHKKYKKLRPLVSKK